MNDREVMQQALYALKLSTPEPRTTDDDYTERGWKEHSAAITALRAALAEPHVWVCPEAADTHRYDKPGHCEDCGKTLIQMAEPVQEPVEWLTGCPECGMDGGCDCPSGTYNPPQREPIHQWRKQMCADWYDGHPDHSDGGGPYETRTLYAAPPQRKPLTEEEVDAMYSVAYRTRESDCALNWYWYERGLRDAEQAHGIRVPKEGA